MDFVGVGCVGGRDEDGHDFQHIDRPCLDEAVVDVEGCDSGQMDEAQKLRASQDGRTLPPSEGRVDLSDFG